MPELIKHLLQYLVHRWPYTVAVFAALGYVASKGLPLIKGWKELRKTTLDTKKTSLEVQQLETKAARVTLATGAEVAEYDPKTQKLLETISRSRDTVGILYNRAHVERGWRYWVGIVSWIVSIVFAFELLFDVIARVIYHLLHFVKK